MMHRSSHTPPVSEAQPVRTDRDATRSPSPESRGRDHTRRAYHPANEPRRFSFSGLPSSPNGLIPPEVLRRNLSQSPDPHPPSKRSTLNGPTSAKGDSTEEQVTSTAQIIEEPDTLDKRDLQTRAEGSVLLATVSIIGDVACELLSASADALSYVPAPGIEAAAHALIGIWKSVMEVKINKRRCLTLADRCAAILYSVHKEMGDSSNSARKELQEPVLKLQETFQDIHKWLEWLSRQTFIMRWLKRDDIHRALDDHGLRLIDARTTFSDSLLFRIHTHVCGQESEHAEILGQPQPSSIAAASPIGPEDRQATLERLRERMEGQDRRDADNDEKDLQKLMQRIVRANNDAEILRTLGVRPDDIPETIKILQRAREVQIERHDPEARTPQTANPRSFTSAGTLELEFIEAGITVLQRQNRTVTLPGWTITHYEVDLVGIKSIKSIKDDPSSFVYKHEWRGRTVAVKLLARETTPPDQFMRQMTIWSTLEHSRVLKLLGASSTSHRQPWFFVLSPYYENGTLVSYLNKLPSLDQVDVFKMIHQIAEGMEYLHGRGVLHGDLRASNVLVDDSGDCIISEFGQIETRSEDSQLESRLPSVSLRWQAPERIFLGSKLTEKIDVYAFAITCVEILAKGELQWLQRQGDNAVRQAVLLRLRPDIPPGLQQAGAPALGRLLHLCWDHRAEERPSFKRINQDMGALCSRSGFLGEHPHRLIERPRSASPTAPNEKAQDERNERRYRMLLKHEFHSSLRLPLWTPSRILIGAVGYHDKTRGGEFVSLFNSMDPGESFPELPDGMPSIHGYGNVRKESVRQDKVQRNIIQRVIDYVWQSASSLAQMWNGDHTSYSRRYSLPLRTGHETAHLFTESTNYRYFEDLAAPKKWFKIHIQSILDKYGGPHNITKEDVCLVVGTLEAQRYALFVSHEHSNGHVEFGVFSAGCTGQPWGDFAVKSEQAQAYPQGGPKWGSQEAVTNHRWAKKVSDYGDGEAWDTVLLSRLRFKPDDPEPTNA